MRILSQRPLQRRQQSGAPSSPSIASADSDLQLGSGSWPLVSSGEPLLSSSVSARFCPASAAALGLPSFSFPANLASPPGSERRGSPGAGCSLPAPPPSAARAALRLSPPRRSAPPPNKQPFVSAEDGG